MVTYSRMFYGEAEIEVSLEEWDDEDLIAELKERNYEVTPKEGHSEYEEIMDDIFELYKEWTDDQGDRDNRFEKAMRTFFGKYMNKVNV